MSLKLVSAIRVGQLVAVGVYPTRGNVFGKVLIVFEVTGPSAGYEVVYR